MITREAVKRIARRRGVTLRALAEHLGYDVGALRRRLQAGPGTLSYDDVLRISALLRVPMEMLDPDLPLTGGGMRRFELADLDTLAQFHERLRYSRSALTVTRGLETYAQPLDFSRWIFTQWQGNQPWDGYEPLRSRYYSQISGTRDLGTFIHRIVAPRDLFVRAAGVEPGWLEGVIDKIDGYDLHTSLALADGWGCLDAAVRRLLPPHASRWEKLTFLDEGLRGDGVPTLMLVRWSTERYAIVHEPQAVLAAFRQCEPLVRSRTIDEFLPGGPPRRSDVREANAAMKRAMYDVLKGANAQR